MTERKIVKYGKQGPKNTAYRAGKDDTYCRKRAACRAGKKGRKFRQRVTGKGRKVEGKGREKTAYRAGKGTLTAGKRGHVVPENGGV